VETGEKLGQLARAFDQLPDYEKAQIVTEATHGTCSEGTRANVTKKDFPR